MKAITITMGDAAGIGPEIIAKAFRDHGEDTRGCFVAGDLEALRRGVRTILVPGETGLPIALITDPSEALHAPPRCMPVLQVAKFAQLPPLGQVSASAGRAAADCVVWAARAA